MRILDRYVIFAFIKNYLITLLVLVGLYIVLDMVFNFDELVEVRDRSDKQGVASFIEIATNAIDYYVHQGFLFFTNLSPIIPGVAAGFTLIRMSRSNELVAILAAGVPLLRVAMPIILVAIVLSSLVVVNQELIIPNMIPQLTRKHDEVGQDLAALGDPINGILDAETNAWLRAARYTPPTATTPAVIDILDVLERDADGQVIGHLSADRAVWDPDQRRWILTNGRYVRGLGQNQVVSEPEAVTELRSSIDPYVIALYRSADVAELLSTRRINELLASGQTLGVAELIKVKHTRWAGVLLNIVMLLITIPAVLTREPGVLSSMAVKCGILVALVMGSVFITQNLAAHPPKPEWLDQWAAFMAFLPIFIFGPVAVWLLRQVKT